MVARPGGGWGDMLTAPKRDTARDGLRGTPAFMSAVNAHAAGSSAYFHRLFQRLRSPLRRCMVGVLPIPRAHWATAKWNQPAFFLPLGQLIASTGEGGWASPVQTALRT